MSNLFIEDDVIFVRDEKDIEKYIWTPLANVLGEWRMLANSHDKYKRQKAAEGYPILLAELSRYKTSLENATAYNCDQELAEYVRDCISQIYEQQVKVAGIQGRIQNTL